MSVPLSRRLVPARTRLDFWFDAAVVLIGLAWYHFAPGSLGGQRGGIVVRGRVVKGLPASAKAPPGATVTPGIHLDSGRSGIPPIQLGDLLQPVNLVVLRNTAGIEAAVIAAVVVVDAGLRKRRRARRTGGEEYGPRGVPR